MKIFRQKPRTYFILLKYPYKKVDRPPLLSILIKNRIKNKKNLVKKGAVGK